MDLALHQNEMESASRRQIEVALHKARLHLLLMTCFSALLRSQLFRVPSVICLALICSNGHGQSTPMDHVAPDGLLAWFPLAQHAEDVSGNGNHLVEMGTPQWTSTGDFAHCFLEGTQSYFYHPDPEFPNTLELSLSVWFRIDSWGTGGGAGTLRPIISKHHSAYDGTLILYSNSSHTLSLSPVVGGYGHNWSLGEWHHAALSLSTDTMKAYVDGQLVLTNTPGDLEITTYPFEIGGWRMGTFGSLSTGQPFHGGLAEIGLWDRPLTEAEIEALFHGAPIAKGCTNPQACNFDSNALANDGSCATCEALQSSCGPGTVWDAALQQCTIAIPQDTDFDGCITAGDVLNLLAAFGTCPAVTNDPNAVASPCQDSTQIHYHGNAYELVEMASHCWFSENLKTPTYLNGDSIPSGLTGTEWGQVQGGAVHFFTDTSGGLYNTAAIFDSRGLCPAGWHVALDEDWIELELELGMSESDAYSSGPRGQIAHELKATPASLPNWQGSGSFGFSLLPDGRRTNTFGTMLEQGTDAYYWMGDTVEPGIYLYRRLMSDSEAIIRDGNGGSPRAGFSVLCVSD